MRIVVTGASGHLGDAVMRRLLSDGHEAVGCTREDLDLRHDRAVAELASRLDPKTALVHLAAWHPRATASTTAEARRLLFETNVLGTMRVLEAARARAVSVVYASTFEVYGAPVSNPIDEDHPTRPLTDYGATKLAGEDHVFAFGYEEKTRVVCLRMPAVYGPGEKRPRALLSFLQAVQRGEVPTAFGDGEDLRDQLYVDDAARAVALAVVRDVSGAFNVADGEAHSIAEIARTAMRVANMSGEPAFASRAMPRRDFHMRIERARRELGFTPEVTLERGMAAEYEALCRRLRTPATT